MFSCFTKCCAKKNSITNHPVKKVSDDTMKDILGMVTNHPNYTVVSRLLNDIRRVDALNKPDSTLYVSSV